VELDGEQSGGLKQTWWDGVKGIYFFAVPRGYTGKRQMEKVKRASSYIKFAWVDTQKKPGGWVYPPKRPAKKPPQI